jgi:hypothetical protein
MGIGGHQYQLADTIAAPALYYRIKINSITGNYFYSRVIVLRDNGSRNNSIRLMTNPVTGNIPLQVVVDKSTSLRLSLIDLAGKVISQQDIVVPAGTSQFNMAVPAGSKGIYMLKAAGGQLNTTMRVVLAK